MSTSLSEGIQYREPFSNNGCNKLDGNQLAKIACLGNFSYDFSLTGDEPRLSLLHTSANDIRSAKSRINLYDDN